MTLVPGTVRPRRLRTTPALRRLVSEARLHPADLILPLFVKETLSEPVPLTSMPGVVQHTLDSLLEAANEAVDAGVGGLMLFGIPEHKDNDGSQADDPEGILNRALTLLRDNLGDTTVIMADLCLDEFTSHGHCGVLDSAGGVDNDATLTRYASMAVAQARSGAHVVGLSGMMDGQVGVCREALDLEGFTDVVVMAYSAKYASAFFGPFREAVDSELQGDRKTYQQDPANGREAMRELDLDLAEGADVVMVKPGMPYLDVLAEAACESPVPVWAYQVSGEYAMIEFAASAGAIDRERAIEESLIAFKRAGADAVLTYWATEVAQRLNAQKPGGAY
ncbi:MAG: porphobilinogen synthase [Brevibacterium sp.]|nr:porphobilinogen synthase [Brevibacterium sp.]